MKTCSKCGESKPFNQFYKDKRATDGLYSACRVCSQKTHQEWRERNPEQVSAIRRRYSLENMEEEVARCYRWRQKNPKAHACQEYTRWAVKQGLLVKPDACEACGESKEPQAHHDDYKKPLEVRWLCAQCHKRHHVKLKEAVSV